MESPENFQAYCRLEPIRDILSNNLWHECNLSYNNINLTRLFFHTVQNNFPLPKSIRAIRERLLALYENDSPTPRDTKVFLKNAWRCFAEHVARYDENKTKWSVQPWLIDDIGSLRNKLRAQYQDDEEKYQALDQLKMNLANPTAEDIRTLFHSFFEFVVAQGIDKPFHNSITPLDQVFEVMIKKNAYTTPDPFDQCDDLLIQVIQDRHNNMLQARVLPPAPRQPHQPSMNIAQVSHASSLQHHFPKVALAAIITGLLFAGVLTAIFVTTPTFTAIAVIHILLHLASAKITVLAGGILGMIIGALTTLEGCYRYDVYHAQTKTRPRTATVPMPSIDSPDTTTVSPPVPQPRQRGAFIRFFPERIQDFLLQETSPRRDPSIVPPTL